MAHTILVTLTDREREALNEIRANLGFRSDEAAVLGGLYKLAAWVEPNVDPILFRLDRETALRETVPVEPDPSQPELFGEDGDDGVSGSDGDRDGDCGAPRVEPSAGGDGDVPG